MICSYCGSARVQMQAVTETKRRGCIATFFLYMIPLITIAAFFLIGFLALLPIIIIIFILLIRGRSRETVTYAVCQDCGGREEIC